MVPKQILELRLLNQQLVGGQSKTPTEAVKRLGAIQAQDYLDSMWSIGLRFLDAKQAMVEDAIINREVVRTWPMRGTLHFVAAEDVRWMINLLAPRVALRNVRRMRRMGITEEVITRSRKLMVEMLGGKMSLTRDEIYRGLGRGGVSPAEQRGLHILWWLAQEGLVCLGARRGRQPTFALLDEWIPKTKALAKDDALPELAERYFVSHGPATLRDFVWWSGLNVSEAKTAVLAVGQRLTKEEVGDVEYWMSSVMRSSKVTRSAHLMPRLDEYVVAYANREAMIEPRFAGRKVRGLPVLFQPKIVVDGVIRGTWRRTLTEEEARIELNPFTRLPGEMLEEITASAERYGRFLGKKAHLVSG